MYDKKIPLLEDWIVQTMEIAEDSDVNIIFMKFNRIGTYVAYQEHMNGIGWRSPISITYKSEKNGCWIIASAEEFWKYNSDAFERHCIDGTTSIS